MNFKKYFSLIFIMIICIIASTNNIYADSSTIYKLKPKYLTTDFNFEMMAATVTQDDYTFSSVGNFRTNKDLAGMSWETEDVLSHIDLKYPTNSDFSGVILEYDYSLSGYTELMNSEISPVITIETNSGDFYYVRLWNYVVNRPLDDWEIGASQQYETTIRFPEGRTPGTATGSTGRIVLDFDNLYAGWVPWYWTEEDEWVPMPGWEKVPVDDIKSIMWSFVPVGYNWETQDMSYLNDSYEYKVDFSNWNVYGDTFLRTEPETQSVQSLRLCDDYDDIYNLTPERVVSEYDKLGYREIVNFYIGASHYYDKKYNGQKMEMKTDYPFNLAFETWYKDYIKRIKERDMDIIHSISMENVDAPEEWWQRAWDGTPASTMWEPTPHLLSFTNSDTKAFLKKYVEELARLSNDAGIKPVIQLGEPWWWFIENEENQPPCFYDQATKNLFLSEKGYPMHEFQSANESIEGHEEMLYWLREQNGKLAHFLRNAVKQKYPNSEFTVLFFTPSVIDKDRVPEMMTIVNFPQEYWQYPNLDFFMIEDYDYLIFDQMDKHLETLTFAQNYLGYPEDKVHYFSGFVLNSDYSYVWKNIEQAINDGFNQGFKEVYLWAYTQIKREGWTPLDIIYASKPSGTYSDTHYVTLSCDGADEIRYTLDGTDPSAINGKIYSKPIYIDSTKLLKTTAVKNGDTRNIVEFRYNMPSIKIPVKIDVDGSSDEWKEIISLSQGTGSIDNLYAVQNSKKLYLLVKGSELNSPNNFYIDIDNNGDTGYHLWCWNNSGADYMIEENMIKKYIGNGDDWNWVQVGTAELVKNSSIIEVSAELSSLGLNEPTDIKVGYSRNYSDYAPVAGNKMAQANGIILDDEDLLAELIYLTSPLESSKNLTARVIVDGGDIDTSRNYYIEAFCSWDNETWYSKGGKNISIPVGEQNNYIDLEYCIFLNGDLYTKVVIYDSKGGTQLGEFVKSETDHVDVGMIENYDWYKFSESYDSDVTVEGYISDIGGYAGEATETVYAITKRSDEEIWRQYSLNNGEWSATGVTYATNPIENGGIMSFSKISPLMTEEKYATMELGLPSIEDIKQMIENKKNELLDKFYVKIGINPAELNSEDVGMIVGGLAISVDDNVYFGLAQWILGAEPHDDNYYFMKAKAFGDSVFTAAYTTASVGSAIEAVRALESAGAAGAMALATAPTGVGGAVLSGATVTELAEAAAMSGISYISGKMAERSQGILKESVAKLKETIGYKVTSRTKGKIVAEKTAEEANQFWKEYYNTDGSTPPYEAGTKVYEIELNEDMTFVRVFEKTGDEFGQWVMKAEDIEGLTPLQIKDKYSLEFIPKYVCDYEIPAGSIIRGGKAGPIPNWGNGGGIQFDLMGQYIGTPRNIRLIQ